MTGQYTRRVPASAKRRSPTYSHRPQPPAPDLDQSVARSGGQYLGFQHGERDHRSLSSAIVKDCRPSVPNQLWIGARFDHPFDADHVEVGLAQLLQHCGVDSKVLDEATILVQFSQEGLHRPQRAREWQIGQRLQILQICFEAVGEYSVTQVIHFAEGPETIHDADRQVPSVAGFQQLLDFLTENVPVGGCYQDVVDITLPA
ncbi:unnamed protein product [Phytophthora fragariaefolia]|uniref:Unnamed protein product n=1 Tax=Phytophthora fragariaefolia TaxID=1490495 RepID=A0A9W6XH75_9STRA|nr:unnamed protein product [Phytophthora fragariaefolia]